MYVAVLDLGTNTFNLAIAREGENKLIDIVYSTKIPVKLGEGGINTGHIAPGAFARGIDAINKHYNTLLDFNVEKLLAFGTSALRTAINGGEFLAKIKDLTGITIEIISGDREAELIYYGVRQTYNMNSDKFLILDIGGGSNEFVIANHKQIFWKKSYKLGIARLLEKFNPSDPISDTEITEIKNFIDTQLSELYEQTTLHKITGLIGASGSFETFLAMIEGRVISDEIASDKISNSTPIPLGLFNSLHSKLIHSTSLERSKMKGLEPMRIEMIVLASLFVNFIIGKLNIQKIIQSNFSLKEGVLYELLKN